MGAVRRDDVGVDCGRPGCCGFGVVVSPLSGMSLQPATYSFGLFYVFTLTLLVCLPLRDI